MHKETGIAVSSQTPTSNLDDMTVVHPLHQYETPEADSSMCTCMAKVVTT